MILTDEDKILFERLARTSEGKRLVLFCERLIQDMVDIRNMKDVTKIEYIEAARIAAGVIDEHFVKRLKVLQGAKVENESEFV